MERPELFRARTFARDRRTWMLTILAAAVLWVGTSAWLNRQVPLAARRPAAPATDGRFVALAFDRIVPMPEARHLDRVALRSHLRALARGGWQAVSLEELRAAYAGDSPLPDKAIVLTFDEGYLSTYEAVDPVLRELHWPAAMFLRTDRQEQRDVSYVFWDRLRRMAGSGLWEVASGEPPPAEAPKSAAPLPDAPPGAHLITDRLDGRPTLAWAPRGASPVDALGCSDAARASRDAERPPRWLGFVDDAIGANRPGGDPYRIARLRVDPSWSSAELVERVDHAVRPPDRLESDGAPVPPAGAVRGDGDVSEQGGAYRLDGAPRAALWIPGALWCDAWVLEATLTPGPGEFWIVQEEDAHGREWRFGGTGGKLYVQSRERGRPPEVLARGAIPPGGDGAARVRVVRRGSGVWITWNGVPVARDPIALPGRPHGKLGFVAYGADAPARLTVADVRFGARPPVVRPVAASPSAEDVQRLSREAPSIAAISPPWGILEGGALREEGLDRDLLSILARRYAWDLLPTIDVRDALQPEGEAWVAGLAGRAREESFSGYYLDLSSVPAASRPAWDPMIHQLDRTLGRAGRRLVVSP